MRPYLPGLALIAALAANAQAQQFEYGDYHGRHDYSTGLPKDIRFDNPSDPDNPFGYVDYNPVSWSTSATPQPAPMYRMQPYRTAAFNPYLARPGAAAPLPHYGPLPPPPPGTPGAAVRPALPRPQMPVAGMGPAVGHNQYTTSEIELAPVPQTATPARPAMRKLPERAPEPNW
jgi:hypothetical protein